MAANTNSTTAPTFAPLAVADLIDHLCAAVDTARASTAPEPWQRAIDRAWDYLLQVDTISYDQTAHAIRVESATVPGVFYTANGDCQCRAFTHGDGVCWHRAAARLVRRALELRDAAYWAAQGFSVNDASYNAQTAAAIHDTRSAAYWAAVARVMQETDQAEARALRDELLACRDLATDFDGALAGAWAVEHVSPLLAYAAAWDRDAAANRAAYFARIVA